MRCACIQSAAPHFPSHLSQFHGFVAGAQYPDEAENETMGRCGCVKRREVLLQLLLGTTVANNAELHGYEGQR